MPDSRSYITHYVKYFNMRAPSVTVQVVILFLLGAAAGGFTSLVIHAQTLAGSSMQIVFSGISAGVLVVSLPALLTVAMIKNVKRKMLLKHAMLITLLITGFYAILLFLGSASFAITKNANFSYLFLLLINAAIYGYWLIMGKFIIGRLRKDALIAAVQPLLNILFFIPLGRYILNFQVPLDITLVKLFAGMLVFLGVGWVFLYLLDRPSKKILEVSGMNIITSMLSEWLFNLTNDVSVIGRGAAARRELSIDVLALRGASGYKGVFVNPDIHFGPFRGAGGSVAPLSMGRLIAEKHKTTPFILHSPLDIQDNPVSASQVYALTSRIEKCIGSMRSFSKAYGNFAIGESGECRSLNVSIGDANLLFLTKAPAVTEDMSREVGIRLRGVAEKVAGKNPILIDAHNCRFESAVQSELAGIQMESAYVRKYEKAITDSARTGKDRRLSFGASHMRIAHRLGDPKDLGEGYTSVCIFKFNGKKLCMLYFDANNMLPAFRDKLLQHIKGKFGISAEVCTSDTHSINTIAYSVETSLGRHTNINKVLPIVDTMMEKALHEIEPVSYAYKRIRVENFPVWGEKADMLIERTSREVRRMLKYGAPLLVALAFVIAAWVIYVV